MASKENPGSLLETVEEGKDKYKMIRWYNLPDWKVHELANCRKGTWRAALMLNQILTNKEIARQGYVTLTDYYRQVSEN